MGTPCHSYVYRADNKMYRINTPQTPIVRPMAHETYAVDTFPTGTNAVVAVISYTAYDMEDAMIINKGAYDRGFGHGTVYTTKYVELTDGEKASSKRFGRLPSEKRGGLIEKDGFLPVGTRIKNDDPFYAYIDEETGTCTVERYKGTEDAVVDSVRLLGPEADQGKAQRVCIKLRINRNPVVGDKFASRHGQKGILSQLWPAEDMPFTESGMVPDIIFNPHGFPSRMTIGMMIESMAAKAGAHHGQFYDATPFTFSEDDRAVDYFGEQLRKAGYNYFGTEPLYSGAHGCEFTADIFVGVVYYQRLRHMVSDKYQVRTTGPVHNLTRQPIKGRKRAGGIRFGEMERDSLLAHGASFLLHDRLVNCSDYSQCHICTKCNSLVAPAQDHSPSMARAKGVTCVVCDSPAGIELISIPYVFRYLVAELLAMNIKVNVNVK
eukprot:Colp12_sorted_trinity150504_noHs@124